MERGEEGLPGELKTRGKGVKKGVKGLKKGNKGRAAGYCQGTKGLQRQCRVEHGEKGNVDKIFVPHGRQSGPSSSFPLF